MKDLFGFDKTKTIYGKGQDVYLPFMVSTTISDIVMPIYDNFNQIVFNNVITIPKEFETLCLIVYDAFKINRPKILYSKLPEKSITLNKNTQDVLLAFSGGLDSCYQAIILKENGYNVHLFHIKGVNAYEGGMQLKAVQSFAQKMGMELICATWKRKGNKTNNKYYQQWGDNAIKNQLIEAIMIDICKEKGWCNISVGFDDTSQSIYDKESVCGINITDCYEIQKSFFSSILNICTNINYVGINYTGKKQRLEKLKTNKLENMYYSCVGSGRFNQYNHLTSEKKYNVLLHKYNCGCFCTKCSLHNLILHYSGIENFNELFLSKCWERLQVTKFGNYNMLFGKDIPLNIRINNLLNY